MNRHTNKEGKVRYLVSHGYGAGWSTWNEEHAEFLLFDKRLVEMALRKASVDDVEAYLDDVFGADVVYCGGWEGISVHYCDKGDEVIVTEYDGAESSNEDRPEGYIA